MAKLKILEKSLLWVTYKRLLHYILPFWSYFVISILGYGMYAATQPLFAELIKLIIETLQSKNQTETLRLPLYFLGLIVIRGIGTYLGGYFLAKVSSSISHTLRCEIFKKYTRLPTTYFDNRNSGAMMSVLTYNVNEVTQATTESMRTFIREGLTAAGLLVYLFYTNWLLSTAFLGVAPIIIVMVKYVNNRLRRLSKLIQNSIGDISHIASELMNGHRLVRSYRGEAYEIQRFLNISDFNRRQSLKMSTTTAIHSPLMQLVIGIALALLMYFALYIREGISAQDFISYLTAAFFLPKPLRQLSDTNTSVQRGLTAAESLFAILDEADEVDSGNYQVERVQGMLEFENVSFSYPNSKELALNKMSFKIMPGQTVALVGASGGGKSTVTNLILRFYTQQQGRILLDGVDINDYQLHNLRGQMALVTQQVTLFNDSVANNIAYSMNAPLEKIKHAAELAYAKEFIEQLPQGFETQIGEHGVKLSGGQKQRLAIARALLKDAPLLILDEATSALDGESERYIQKALNEVISGRTSLIIAHRLSTIEHADLILVIDKGQIVERGTHQELIGKNGAYSRLHNVQFVE